MRGGLLPGLGFDGMGDDVAVQTAAQMGAAGVVKALPDFSLPEVIVGFDLVLEALLARWREDGGDAHGQAEEGDRTEPIGMGMGAMKTEVIVELGVGGQAVGVPMGEQGLVRELGRDGKVQEAAAKAAVQGDSVANLDFAAGLADASLDEVKGVQLRAGSGDVWEMPTRR